MLTRITCVAIRAIIFDCAVDRDLLLEEAMLRFPTIQRSTDLSPRSAITSIVPIPHRGVVVDQLNQQFPHRFSTKQALSNTHATTITITKIHRRSLHRRRSLGDCSRCTPESPLPALECALL